MRLDGSAVALWKGAWKRCAERQAGVDELLAGYVLHDDLGAYQVLNLEGLPPEFNKIAGVPKPGGGQDLQCTLQPPKIAFDSTGRTPSVIQGLALVAISLASREAG